MSTPSPEVLKPLKTWSHLAGRRRPELDRVVGARVGHPPRLRGGGGAAALGGAGSQVGEDVGDV